MELRTLELFSGVGMLGEGLRAGLRHLGFETRTLAHVEREAYADAVLAARMEEGSMDAAPIWSDVCTFDAAAWHGRVDCVVAGFPCQDLSVAGRRAGLDGKRSGLFFEVVRIATDSGAWCMWLENVAGIATATATVVDEAAAAEITGERYRPAGEAVGEADGVVFERAAARVLGELADLGWDAEWITLSASDVGASHGRARWFCFAWRTLADAKGQRGKERQRPELAGRTAMEQPACFGWQERRPESAGQQGRPDAPIDGRSVADTDGHQLRPDGRGPDVEPDGRHNVARCGQALAHASGARLQERTGGGGCDCDPLQQAGRREPAGVHRALDLFAPGPADPAWPGILAAHPELAPALERRLNPNFVEYLMGWPIGWTNTTTRQKHDLEEGPARNTARWQDLLALRLGHFFDEAPRGLQQASGRSDSVSQLPPETSPGPQPEWATGASSLQGVHDAVSTETRASSEVVRQPGVPEEVRRRRCEEAMENRAGRLKAGGNGVVALSAAAAFVILARRSGMLNRSNFAESRALQEAA